MHIMEGFLPAKHAIAWSAAAAPFVGYGLYSISKRIKKHPEQRMLLGVAAAFTFVLSALKMPSVTGSCSHPTGTGLGAVLFGPVAMAPIGLVVLLFQALLLAHGGLTTLGANTFSMAIVGPLAAALVFRLARGVKLSLGLSVFFAASVADLLTYVTTSLQLALAFPMAALSRNNDGGALRFLDQEYPRAAPHLLGAVGGGLALLALTLATAWSNW